MILNSMLTFLAACGLSIHQAHGQMSYSHNGLAMTPQMGWDNWNAFKCDITEKDLIDTAQKIVDYGLRDLGYQYIILDDCWSTGRAPNGTLQPNMTKFPSGMNGVADQIHDLGLKFGMYSSAGILTCAQYPGSLGHEKLDAQTFADWGVDYLKYDNCYNAGQSGTPKLTHDRYLAMSFALNQTGRPIFYSMCNWGEDSPWQWAQTMANSWRMSGDIYDSFDRPDERCPCTNAYDCRLAGFHCSVTNILNKVAPIVDRGRPGGWNDLDSLEVGNGGMTDDEYKAHFSMWAMVKSPLIMGNDITTMSPATLSILSNPAIIAINQDPLGMSAIRVWQYNATVDNYGQGTYELWVAKLSGGDYAVALLNFGNDTLAINATLQDIFYDKSSTGAKSPAAEVAESWDVYDCWANHLDDTTASAIIAGNATMNATTMSVSTYNATATSYKSGLQNNDTMLLGTKVESVAPMGTLNADVPAHGVAVYRLRVSPMMKRKRDEL